MSSPQADLVIFDCDGVLIDSEIIAARVEAKLLTEAGVAIAAEEIMERYSGLNFGEMMKDIERNADVPLSASMLDQCEKQIDEKLKKVKILPGAMALVAGLKTPKCVCSNSASYRLANTLKLTGLKPLFGDNIFSSRDVGTKKPKPAPDVFTFAIEKFGADPSKTIVVEDSVHGVEGARKAGARVVGYTGASHIQPGHADRLTEAGAETVINRLADLPEVIEALMIWTDDVGF